MFSTVQHIDEILLRSNHLGCANPVLDTLTVFFRNPYFWAPVYLFLLIWMFQSFGQKGLWWCGFFLLTFLFCDAISASLIKPIIHRIRPCNDLELPFTLRQLVHCGSGFSFPSSHATNHVGFAVFIILTLRHIHKWVVPLAISWALVICFSQVYVAVHYPSDILGGAILGSAIGWFNARYFKYRIGILQQN